MFYVIAISRTHVENSDVIYFLHRFLSITTGKWYVSYYKYAYAFATANLVTFPSLDKVNLEMFQLLSLALRQTIR